MPLLGVILGIGLVAQRPPARAPAGRPAAYGDRVTVDYEVRVGTRLLDSTIRRNLPFTYVLDTEAPTFLDAKVVGLAPGRSVKFRLKNRPEPLANRIYAEYPSSTVLDVWVSLRTSAKAKSPYLAPKPAKTRNRT